MSLRAALRPALRRLSSAALEVDRADSALLHAHPWSRIAELVALALPDDAQFREAVLLDVKSSHGGLATQLARSHPHATVTMTDPSPERVHEARIEYLSELSNLRVAELVGPTPWRQFANGTVDVVTSCFGFGPSESHRDVLSELLRILKPGGSLIGTLWLDSAAARLAHDVLVASRGEAAPPPIAPTPLAAVDAMLLESGFDFKTRAVWLDEVSLDFGRTADEQYRRGTRAIRPWLDALDEEEVEARRAFFEHAPAYAVQTPVVQRLAAAIKDDVGANAGGSALVKTSAGVPDWLRQGRLVRLSDCAPLGTGHHHGQDDRWEVLSADKGGVRLLRHGRKNSDQADATTYRHVPVEEITPDLITPAAVEEEAPLVVGPNRFAVFTVKKYDY